MYQKQITLHQSKETNFNNSYLKRGTLFKSINLTN